MAPFSFTRWILVQLLLSHFHWVFPLFRPCMATNQTLVPSQNWIPTQLQLLLLMAFCATQLAILKTHLEAAQKRMKVNADKHHTERVLLWLQPYAQKSVENRPLPKLAVLERIGQVAYRLQLPLTAIYTMCFMCPSWKSIEQTIIQCSLTCKHYLHWTHYRWNLGWFSSEEWWKKGNSSVVQGLIKWANLFEEAEMFWRPVIPLYSLGDKWVLLRRRQCDARQRCTVVTRQCHGVGDVLVWH